MAKMLLDIPEPIYVAIRHTASLERKPGERANAQRVIIRILEEAVSRK
jgi:hypothetical protein